MGGDGVPLESLPRVVTSHRSHGFTLGRLLTDYWLSEMDVIALSVLQITLP